MDVQVSMPPPPPPPPPPAFFTETTTVVPPPPQPVTTTTTTTTTVSVASPPTQDRIWLHPWTVNEMREHASQWSLAGDAGVLLYLEQFSDRLTQRADAIHQHLNQTIDAVKSTHTRVLNCLNEFTSLANTQFIENRVYDEDETANTTTTGSKKDEQTTDKTNVNNTEAQEKVLQRYVEAIQYGLAILDTHFERVEPKLDNNQNGGSSFVDDDEDGGIPLEPILEPKDPYISRPLPHLIGTPEFMQDDYVGLGDLLTLLDEDGYEVEQIAKVDSDSALSSSDEEEEEEEPGEQDFQAQISPAPLVPAGASRSDLANRPPPPPTTILTDSDDDDDDPFGINKNIPKINNISSKQPTEDDNLFDDEPKPSKKVDFAPADFFKDSDKEDNLFDNPTKKPQSITVDKNDSSDDESSASSKESDEPEVPKKKVKSELELAVERRRKAMADPVLSSGDEDDDELVKKPTKPSNETISSLVNKPKSKPKSSSEVPSSSTILNLTSQPLTKPKSSIFGEHDDDDDLFSDAPKLATTISSSSTTTTKIDTKLSLKTAPKKEKDMFDEDSDEYDDPFSSKKNTSTITKKNEPIPKVQPTIINKPKPIIHSDDSEEDTIFGTKSTPIVTEKNKPHSSDDELFPTSTITKLQPQTSTKSTKLSEDEEPLFIDKSPVKPVISSPAPAPVVVPSVPKPKPTVNEDSDDEILGISKKPPQPSTTGPQKVIAPTKPDDDDDDLFGKPPATSNLSKTEISKVIPSVNSDEDDILLPPKPTQLKLPPPVNLPPLPSPPSTKPDVYKGPLGIQTPVQSTPQSPPIKTSSVPVKQKLPDDDSDEDSTSKPSLNPLASEGNKKLSVKDLALGLKIPTGAHKPGVRRKASSITEEPPKPSVDDDQPIQNVEPPPTPVKKITKLALDSDDEDDDLFSNNKKTPTTPIVEPKDKTNIENETGKNKIKDLSSRITIKPMMPGARPPPISNESNNATHTTSNEASKEEPIVDKAMLNILKDRAKGPIRTRAAPTRKARPTGAAAAAISTDENDDLFASPKSTNTIPSSPPASAAVPVIPPLASAAVPVIPPPASAAVPVIPPPSTTVPPPVPVTGLLDKTAAIAAISDKQTNSKEKKKFSLFDSDDSDIDELLFGFSKKTKSPVVSKPTATSKATTKSSILPLDDDNDDFLAKRPIKKNTKPVDNDDIFADVKGKDPQINKAKKDWSIMGKSATAETDDIFNDTATKTSAKPKPTATKNKTKNFDDLFDDPLNISSKS